VGEGRVSGLARGSLVGKGRLQRSFRSLTRRNLGSKGGFKRGDALRDAVVVGVAVLGGHAEREGDDADQDDDRREPGKTHAHRKPPDNGQEGGPAGRCTIQVQPGSAQRFSYRAGPSAARWRSSSSRCWT